MPRPQVLYITYDGLMEPLGQSQVLPYLRGLADQFAITVLSFEKPQDWADSARRRALEEQIALAGLAWIPLRYHKRPSLPATAFDIVHGVMSVVRRSATIAPKMVHVRGYVPGVIGLALKRLLGTRLIFDMRGFWPDEKVDGGAWRHGSGVYRAAKWFERKLLERADVVVSLTHAGVAAMGEFPYLKGRATRFEVIPTCTDLELFQPEEGKRRNGSREFVLGYAGSVGTFYLFDEVLECFNELLRVRPDARLLIVNRGAHEYIQARIKALGTPPEKVELRSAEYREMPAQIRRMDAGAFFIKPVFSKKSSAPTRLGEFLGCGVPCLANAGVGDMDAVVRSGRVGVVMEKFSPESRQAAVRELLTLATEEGIGARCVRAAHQHFALEQGVAAYRRIYCDLTGQEVALKAPKSAIPGAGLEYDREFSHQ